MKAYEVTDGFDEIFCETEAEAALVATEMKRRASAIGDRLQVFITPVEITSIPDSERRYVARLRDADDVTPGAGSAAGSAAGAE